MYPRRTGDTTRMTCPECGKRLNGYVGTEGIQYWRCVDQKCFGTRNASGFGREWDYERMVREGPRIEGVVGRVWHVTSRTRPGAEYRVEGSPSQGTLSCTCPGWLARGRCFHCDKIAEKNGILTLNRRPYVTRRSPGSEHQQVQDSDEKKPSPPTSPLPSDLRPPRRRQSSGCLGMATILAQGILFGLIVVLSITVML
jgi:hypothetical protein